MYSRLDDALIDHPKVCAAGEALGANGRVIAIGFYAIGLMWVNKHLTDGHIPRATVRDFPVNDPIAVADALVTVGLWEKNGNGYVIHDYTAHNRTREVVLAYRERERRRVHRTRRSGARKK